MQQRERASGALQPAAAPTLLIDAMLGKVARDLRLLGYDAAYAGRAPDCRILRQCQAEGRVLVTRDRALARRARSIPCIFVTETAPDRQTIEVLRALGRRPDAGMPLSRCLACNGRLAPLATEEAWERVPDHVAVTHDAFTECPDCGRVYWPGSHTGRLQEKIRRTAESLHPRTSRV